MTRGVRIKDWSISLIQGLLVYGITMATIVRVIQDEDSLMRIMVVQVGLFR